MSCCTWQWWQWPHGDNNRFLCYFYHVARVARTHTHTDRQTIKTVFMFSHLFSGTYKTTGSHRKETVWKQTAQTHAYRHVLCCPGVCWGCARRWVWHRLLWPFGREQSGSFCARGLRLEEIHYTYRKTNKNNHRMKKRNTEQASYSSNSY